MAVAMTRMTVSVVVTLTMTMPVMLSAGGFALFQLLRSRRMQAQFGQILSHTHTHTHTQKKKEGT
jgi:hypothetical protein